MTKIRTTLLALATLTVGGLSVQAQATYYDAADFLQSGSTSPNLFVTDPNGPLLAGTGDGDTSWRYRNTGPGGSAWNTNAYQIKFSEGDTPGYQAISGLVPGQSYEVMIFGVYPNNTTNAPLPGSRYGIDVSFDNATWKTIDNRGGATIHWVDNSSELGASLPTVGAGDTRFWSLVPGLATADGTGALNIYLQAPDLLSDGSVPDRFVLDGFALQVPEPTTFALAGLGLVTLLVSRRRRR